MFPSDFDVAGSEISSRDGGFDLSWPASSNASFGYAVEWVGTSCGQRCSVDWLKVPKTTTSARIESRKYKLQVNQGYYSEIPLNCR